MEVVCGIEGETRVEARRRDGERMVVDRIGGNVVGGGKMVESGLGEIVVSGKIVGWVVVEGAGMGKHLYGSQHGGWRREEEGRRGRRRECGGEERDRGRNVGGRDWQVVRYAESRVGVYLMQQMTGLQSLESDALCTAANGVEPGRWLARVAVQHALGTGGRAGEEGRARREGGLRGGWSLAGSEVSKDGFSHRSQTAFVLSCLPSICLSRPRRSSQCWRARSEGGRVRRAP